jgi:hypothetical protein
MADQFDELAKSLAEGVSRREALRGIGATIVGIVLSSLGLPVRAAPSDPCCRDVCRGSVVRGGRCVKACESPVTPRLRMRRPIAEAIRRTATRLDRSRIS